MPPNSTHVDVNVIFRLKGDVNSPQGWEKDWTLVCKCLCVYESRRAWGPLFLFSLQNEYMKDNFLIKIETWHKPDMGHLENVTMKRTQTLGTAVSECFSSVWPRPVALFQVHGLDAETWKKVDVVYIDIADRSQVEPKVNEFSKMDSCICRLLSPHFVFLCVCLSLSPGLQARGGPLQVQVSEDRTGASRTRLEGTEILLIVVAVGLGFQNTWRVT